MSGGSWNYAFRHVEEMAEGLAQSPDAIRRAFAAHLVLVAEAMHAVEWVDSCDYGRGDERAPIEVVLGAASATLEHEAARARLAEEIERAIETFRRAASTPTTGGPK